MRKPKVVFDFMFVYGVTVALAVALILPVVVVAAGSVLNTSFLGLSSETWAPASASLFTARWFRYVIDLYGTSMVFSVKLALLSVATCLVVGVPGGAVLATRQFRGSRVLEELILLPLSMPGIVMSVGLIQAYAIVRGRWWFVWLGHLAYTIPFMVRTVTNTLRSFDLRTLEEAARSLGAGPWRRAWLVILPSLRHAMIVGSLLVFAVSWGEFNVSYLLNTPLHQTFPAALYATYTSNSFQVSSAATVLFLAIVAPALVAIQWIGGRDLVAVDQGA